MMPEPPLEPRAPTSSGRRPGASYGPGRQRGPNFGRRRQLRNRLLRGALLLALIAGVGGLTAIFLQGRNERLAAAEPAIAERAAGATEEPEAPTESAQLSAGQFESTLEREGVEVFRIRGARTSSDEHGNVFLKQVEVDYPQGEDRYSLSADAADYNEETQATRLQGAVSLQGTNGLTVDTDWMDLAEGGMLLTAADDSRFSLEGVTARGDGLHMDFREEIARMGGGVRLFDAEEPGAGVAENDPSQALSLAAETLEYGWGAGIVRALGGARMQFGTFTLAARSLTLIQDESDVLAGLEARGEIEVRAPLGAGAPAAGGDGAATEEAILVLRGDALDVQFDDARFPGRVVLSGPNWGGPAVLRIDYGDGARRRIRARLLEFSFVEGVPAEFASRGRVELQEHAPGRARPLREASSVTAHGRFDAEGALAELRLGGNVELTDRSGATVLARADAATIDPSAQRLDFQGQPARLVHSRGELEGASILYDQAGGCSEAGGGVRFTFSGGEAGSGVMPFGGDAADAGPSVLTAEEALLCEAGRSEFRGGVEVRRGADLLAAAQLQVAADGRRMIANGDVRTIWHAQPAAGSMPAEEADAAGAPERWSIVAARLNYEEDDGELRYTGGAAAALGDQTLECDELTVEAVPDGPEPGAGGFRAQGFFCLGNARIHDIGSGRSAEADRAIYAFAERRIRLFGNVVLRQGTDEMRGSSLVYWIDRNRYELGPSGSLAAGAGDP